MRDADRSSGDYRNEEWIYHGVPPAEVDRTARRHTRGRFAVCAFHAMHEPDTPIRDGFKSLGYRLARTEPLMVHSLRRIPRFDVHPDAPATIERVTSQAMADRLAKAARKRQLLPEHLAADPRKAPLRHYVALLDGDIAGWVRSIAAGDAAWCSDMYVHPQFRRRGIARAMLSRMLRDDRAAGARQAVLLSSHTAAKLYPVVGYEQIGTLLLFTPPRNARSGR